MNKQLIMLVEYAAWDWVCPKDLTDKELEFVRKSALKFVSSQEPDSFGVMDAIQLVQSIDKQKDLIRQYCDGTVKGEKALALELIADEILRHGHRWFTSPPPRGWLIGAQLSWVMDFSERSEQAQYDNVAFEVACREASFHIAESNLSESVKAFVTGVLLRTIVPPTNRGKHPVAYKPRDRYIASLIKFLELRGFRATRNDASEHRVSACDILSDALLASGSSYLSYDALKRIWLKNRGAD